MVTLVVVLFNVHLKSVKKKKNQKQEVTITIIQEKATKPSRVLVSQHKAKKQTKPKRNFKTHEAYNETEKSKPSKSKEQRKKKQNTSKKTKKSSGLVTDFEARLEQLVEKRNERQQRLTTQNTSNKGFNKRLKEKSTSVFYTLLERRAHAIPTPVYTCTEGGKVAVNIKVNAQGFVTKAAFNASRSKTRNRCLIDNAIAYALRAQFSPGNQKIQRGIITYVFQKK